MFRGLILIVLLAYMGVVIAQDEQPKTLRIVPDELLEQERLTDPTPLGFPDELLTDRKRKLKALGAHLKTSRKGYWGSTRSLSAPKLGSVDVIALRDKNKNRLKQDLKEVLRQHSDLLELIDTFEFEIDKITEDHAVGSDEIFYRLLLKQTINSYPVALNSYVIIDENSDVTYISIASADPSQPNAAAYLLLSKNQMYSSAVRALAECPDLDTIDAAEFKDYGITYIRADDDFTVQPILTLRFRGYSANVNAITGEATAGKLSRRISAGGAPAFCGFTQ